MKNPLPTTDSSFFENNSKILKEKLIIELKNEIYKKDESIKNLNFKIESLNFKINKNNEYQNKNIIL